MGTFDYVCNDCGRKFEYTIIGNGDPQMPHCPCGSYNVEKKFSVCRGVALGMVSDDPDSELYIRPDKPDNPARKWYKLARNYEKYEEEGKIEKCDDNIHESIKAWTDAGYEL